MRKTRSGKSAGFAGGYLLLSGSPALLSRRRSRRGVTLLELLVVMLILLMVIGYTATGLALAQEVQSLVQTVQNILLDLPGLLESVSGMVIVVGPLRVDLAQFDLPSLAEQAMVYVRPFLGEASGVVTSLAG
ncbi:MAG: prepilin-type N-terminal cleavage/methylation domain-containing protein, partial [Pirellulales bacterium]